MHAVVDAHYKLQNINCAVLDVQNQLCCTYVLYQLGSTNSVED